MIKSFPSLNLKIYANQVVFFIFCLLVLPVFAQVCGDGSYDAATQSCNDGNLVNGDGCDSNCQTETNHSCVNTVGSISKCMIYVKVKLAFMGVVRDTSTNSA